ncbi:MAG TPA: hypothetical protein VFK03_02690 [Candidatus Saccharimonadales bacterium]|nr:hypothetical protein [Candidatus Saccharimonadales bacterium]
MDRAAALHEATQKTRDPVVVAKEVDPNKLSVVNKGANRYYVHTEVFRSPEEAGDYLRRLRRIATFYRFHEQGS